MNQEDIIKLAREVGIPTGRIGGYDKELKRFAAFVAAAEREVCAKIVEDYCGAWDDEGYALAAAIRARGEK